MMDTYNWANRFMRVVSGLRLQEILVAKYKHNAVFFYDDKLPTSCGLYT